MDADLYDEFGNYIGPNIVSDEEEVAEDSDDAEEEQDEADEDHSKAIDLLEKTDESLAVSHYSLYFHESNCTDVFLSNHKFYWFDFS